MALESLAQATPGKFDNGERPRERTFFFRGVALEKNGEKGLSKDQAPVSQLQGSLTNGERPRERTFFSRGVALEENEEEGLI